MIHKQATPKAGIWCKDERLSRLVEIQLGMCGVVECIHLWQDPYKASDCLLWLVDLDDFPYENLPPPPDGCGLYGWSKDHETSMAMGGVMRYCWHRPFSMTAFESAICQDLYDTSLLSLRPILSYPTLGETKPAHPSRPFSSHGLSVVKEGVVAVGDVLVSLTKQEWVLFACLWERRGQVTPKHVLWEVLCATQEGEAPSTNTLEVYICHLRRKLEKPTGRRFITTKRGVGYVLEER